jgi:hypothetical protein
MCIIVIEIRPKLLALSPTAFSLAWLERTGFGKRATTGTQNSNESRRDITAFVSKGQQEMLNTNKM